MNAFEVIRQVEAHGGSLTVEHDELRVRASAPLPDELMEALSAQKPQIMIALGTSIDVTVGSILTEIRPYLSPALRRLTDERLLTLVNWNIITAWDAAVRKASEGPPRRAARSR